MKKVKRFSSCRTKDRERAAISASETSEALLLHVF